MRGKLAILSFCGMLAALPAHAQDDFFVDFSALDSLGGGYVAEESELLFPTVKPENTVKPVVEPKATVKAKEEQPVKAEVLLPAEKPAIRPESSGLAENEPALPKDEPVLPEVLPTTEKTEAAPAPAEEKVLPIEPELSREDIAVVENPEVLPRPQQTEPVVPAVMPEPQTAAEVSSQPKIEPLIDSSDDGEETFIFADGSYEVTADMKQQLEDLVKRFENPAINKILIVAYNYDKDNGFMSKHICLKRSTGLRSHLLNQGYKNFSIKIINTDNPQQKNLVEVSEIN